MLFPIQKIESASDTRHMDSADMVADHTSAGHMVAGTPAGLAGHMVAGTSADPPAHMVAGTSADPPAHMVAGTSADPPAHTVAAHIVVA